MREKVKCKEVNPGFFKIQYGEYCLRMIRVNPIRPAEKDSRLTCFRIITDNDWLAQGQHLWGRGVGPNFGFNVCTYVVTEDPKRWS